MNSRIYRILANITAEQAPILKIIQRSLPARIQIQKKTSNKSTLKMKKKSPNVKYKSSKPITSSRGKQTFRNKSNLR